MDPLDPVAVTTAGIAEPIMAQRPTYLPGGVQRWRPCARSSLVVRDRRMIAVSAVPPGF